MKNSETTETANTDIDTLILLRHGPQQITREYLHALPTSVLKDMGRSLSKDMNTLLLSSESEHIELVEHLLLIYKMYATYVKVYDKSAAVRRLVERFHDRLTYYLRRYYEQKT